MTYSNVKVKNGTIKIDRKTDRKLVDIFVRKDKERQSTSRNK
jgi:hypothetical protein